MPAADPSGIVFPVFAAPLRHMIRLLRESGVRLRKPRGLSELPDLRALVHVGGRVIELLGDLLVRSSPSNRRWRIKQACFTTRGSANALTTSVRSSTVPVPPASSTSPAIPVALFSSWPRRATACPETRSDLGKWVLGNPVFPGIVAGSGILAGSTGFPRPSRRRVIFQAAEIPVVVPPRQVLDLARETAAGRPEQGTDEPPIGVRTEQDDWLRPCRRLEAPPCRAGQEQKQASCGLLR